MAGLVYPALAFTANQTSENSSLASLLNGTTIKTVRIYGNQSNALKNRNLFLGLVGIGLNLSGIALLAMCSKVKSSLKISLISLALNDLLFISDVFSNGFFEFVKTTNHPFCWPTLYIGFASLLISYMGICVLAFQNYIAVFYPFRCSMILTTHRMCIATVSVWVAGFLIGLGFVGTHFETGIICVALAPMPMYGVGGIAALCVACVSCVAFMNFKIFLKVRKGNRLVEDSGTSATLTITQTSNVSTSSVLPKLPELQRRNMRSPKATVTGRDSAESLKASSAIIETRALPSSLPSSLTDKPLQDNNSLISSPRPHEVSHESDLFNKVKQTNNMLPSNLDDVIAAMTPKVKLENSELSVSFNPDNDITSQVASCTNHETPKTESLCAEPSCSSSETPSTIKQTIPSPGSDAPNMNTPTSLFVISPAINLHSQALQEPARKKLSKINLQGTTQYISNAKDSSLKKTKSKLRATDTPMLVTPNLSSVSTSSSARSDYLSPSTPITSNNFSSRDMMQMRRHRRVKLRNTLSILTLWSCFLTLPYLIYMLTVAAGTNRGKFAQSDMGIFLSSLVFINALTNPLFYAWRFIEWRQMRLKIVRMFSRCCPSCRLTRTHN